MSENGLSEEAIAAARRSAEEAPPPSAQALRRVGAVLEQREETPA